MGQSGTGWKAAAPPLESARINAVTGTPVLRRPRTDAGSIPRIDRRIKYFERHHGTAGTVSRKRTILRSVKGWRISSNERVVPALLLFEHHLPERHPERVVGLGTQGMSRSCLGRWDLGPAALEAETGGKAALSQSGKCSSPGLPTFHSCKVRAMRPQKGGRNCAAAVQSAVSTSLR